LVQSSLEARVQARTAELEASGREQARFLAAMSHELRTPLNGVIAVSRVLAARQHDDESRRMVELIVESGHRLERTLADMVEVAGLDAGDIALCVEPFDLTALVAHAGALHRPAAEAKGLRLDTACAPECAGAYLGDAQRITQVLSHYLANAVKFTDAGWVSLRVARGAGDALRFTVSDTGRGLDEAQRSRLFERGAGAAERGTGAAGLGLALCRAVARAMGGEVAASSRPGVGSMFTLTVTLPPAPISLPAEPERSGQEAPPLTGTRMLLAEGGAANRRLLALILDGAGAQLRVASDGAEALEAFGEAPFDMVLLDAHLPDLDGLAVVRELRAREAEAPARTPVILMTAESRRDPRGAALKAGADGVICKPIHATELVAVISALLSPGPRPQVQAA
ncbi:MAG: response regulator, partial [Caulobacteraceae bacterium]|nr:response regulator [Caulobacter sp.]